MWNKKAAIGDQLFLRKTDLLGKYIEANGSRISYREENYKYGKGENQNKVGIGSTAIYSYSFQYVQIQRYIDVCVVGGAYVCVHLFLFPSFVP